MTDAIAHITVGVADLERVLGLWQRTFGMEIVARREGADAGLAEIWDLEADRIERQALIRTPGTSAGWLHLVQFAKPAAAVRAGASPMDLGPKNLDVYCDDIRARVAALGEEGWRFLSGVIDYQVAGIHASEIQMPGPDDTNIVFVEVAGDPVTVSAQGYGGITSFVIIVPDLDVEGSFYRRVFGFDDLLRHRITGAEIEEIVNLPSAVGVEMLVLGHEEQRYGRVELIQYDGSPGVNRFSRAQAPALGSLHCAFRVASVDAVLNSFAGSARRFESVDTLFSSGPFGVIHSPAGLRVEIFE